MPDPRFVAYKMKNMKKYYFKWQDFFAYFPIVFGSRCRLQRLHFLHVAFLWKKPRYARDAR
jgi:hypothetical protein